MTPNSRPGGLLVVSNRAPYTIRRRGGKTELIRTVGGLATTLDDTLQNHGGTWLAWSGNVAAARTGRSAATLSRSFQAPGGGYRLRLINLTERQVTRFYLGFANRSLWPLCHYFIERCRFDPGEWRSYREVNRVFANAAARMISDTQVAWIHDFQLALVPGILRAKRPETRIAMFWHIPFPAGDVFRVNPWAREVVEGMLGADLIGFHTTSYARHFLHAAADIVGAHIDLDRGEAVYEGHTTRAGAFPIGVEGEVFTELGRSRSVLHGAQNLRKTLDAEKILLGVDRLDYTKGIVERLEAYEQLLADYPEFQRKVCLVQIQVPSRENVPEYRELREQLDRIVGRISGRFSSAGWVPVRYLCRAFQRRDLAIYFRAADVLLVTPLRDGMNLVAKEFVATREDEGGVLLLSELAGAAEGLPEATLVNPYDRDGMVEAFRAALQTPRSERRVAMRAMRRRVLTEDVNWWLDQSLTAMAEITRARPPRSHKKK